MLFIARKPLRNHIHIYAEAPSFCVHCNPSCLCLDLRDTESKNKVISGGQRRWMPVALPNNKTGTPFDDRPRLLIKVDYWIHPNPLWRELPRLPHVLIAAFMTPPCSGCRIMPLGRLVGAWHYAKDGYGGDAWGVTIRTLRTRDAMFHYSCHPNFCLCNHRS